MENKYIFIDIDGTLLDPVTGVPDSAVAAIRSARSNGHKVFICTGRAKITIPETVNQIGFDGYVCAAGAYAETDGEILLMENLDKDKVKKLMAPINSKKIGCLLEGYRATYGNKWIGGYAERLYEIDAFLKELLIKYDWDPSRIPGEEEYYNGQEVINKISLLADHVDDLTSLQQFLPEQWKLTIHDPNSEGVYLCEIAIKTISKASGIERILAHDKIPRDRTICYGDSMNDIEMLQYCGIGICMGNGSPALMAVADDVAESVTQDGIFNSFIKYGIIQHPAK